MASNLGSEIPGWLRDAGLAELMADGLFAEYLSGVVTAKAISESDAIYERMRAAMTGTPSPLALKKARNLATQQAERLARDMAKTELNKMGRVIADGIEQGLGPREIARNLDMVKGLDQNRAGSYLEFKDYLDTLDIDEATYNARLERKFEKLLKDRKETIAQCEQRKATSGANFEEAKARGAKWKGWMTAGDDRVRPDHAKAEAQGMVPIGKKFSNGEMFPGEPNCRCTVFYITYRDQLKKANQEQKKRAARTAAAIKAAKDGDGGDES